MIMYILNDDAFTITKKKTRSVNARAFNALVCLFTCLIGNIPFIRFSLGVFVIVKNENSYQRLWLLTMQRQYILKRIKSAKLIMFS